MRIVPHTILVLSLLAWLIPSPALAKQTLSYGSDPAQALDLYQASGSGLHGLVVFVHGGGWIEGSKNSGQLAAKLLNPYGYTVASIEYRMFPQTDGQGEAEDIARSIAYLIQNAQTLGINSHSVALMGHSAGGHLVALIGTDSRYLSSVELDTSAVQVIITLDGVFELASSIPNFSLAQGQQLFGPTKESWQRFSPVSLVGTMRMHPLFCIMHEDTNPRFTPQADLFVKTLKDHDEKAREGVANGLNHGQLYGELLNPNQPMAGFILQCLNDAGMPQQVH
jgi:acetyl esterase/lipase